MAMISAFTFVHNALESGYPIVEAVRAVQPYVDEVVAVDCQSNDGTREVLEKLGCRVLDGAWWPGAGRALAQAHARHGDCAGETIIHFEADEVYDPGLLRAVIDMLEAGHRDLAVWRLQVEQNFQRIRWYPELVHRVFPRGSCVKVGHTTNMHRAALPVGMEHGFLWDCTNCFRDNWQARVENQAWLWDEAPRYRAVPFHFKQPVEMEEAEIETFLLQPHWEWKTTPLALPDNLRRLVGVTEYHAQV